MSKLLFIEDDDIVGLSNALRDALERRGIVFKEDGTGEFDYPFGEAIDPYDGLTATHEEPLYLHPYGHGGCGSGGCGGRITTGSCGSGGCGGFHIPSYGGCGYAPSYPRC